MNNEHYDRLTTCNQNNPYKQNLTCVPFKLPLVNGGQDYLLDEELHQSDQRLTFQNQEVSNRPHTYHVTYHMTKGQKNDIKNTTEIIKIVHYLLVTNMAHGFSKTSSSNNSAAVSDESELSTRLQGTACIPSNEQQHTVTTVAHTVQQLLQ